MKKFNCILFLLMLVSYGQVIGQVQPSVYPMPQKIFVVSDVEGELDLFKKLLGGNKVIDKAARWSFGKGHVVVCGDLFDRGEQVEELLWFLVALEDQAKASGGYVHVILGNHDIMNLSGDFRYVKPKYFEQAKRLGKEYKDFYRDSTVLGAWLRSKNVMEKIGSFLFVHGGVSPQVLALGKSLEEINALSRPYYAKEASLVPPNLKVLFGRNSPFWYRGYFLAPRAGIGLVDSTLAFYGASHIVVGHTILARNIALYYGGKVIGVDVDYHQGRSAAALFVRGKWYAVDSSGRKVPLVYKPENDQLTDQDIL